MDLFAISELIAADFEPHLWLIQRKFHRASEKITLFWFSLSNLYKYVRPDTATFTNNSCYSPLRDINWNAYFENRDNDFSHHHPYGGMALLQRHLSRQERCCLCKYSQCNSNQSPIPLVRVNSFIRLFTSLYYFWAASHSFRISWLRPGHHTRCLHRVVKLICFIKLLKISGVRGRNRTFDTQIKGLLLCQLSYTNIRKPVISPRSQRVTINSAMAPRAGAVVFANRSQTSVGRRDPTVIGGGVWIVARADKQVYNRWVGTNYKKLPIRGRNKHETTFAHEKRCLTQSWNLQIIPHQRLSSETERDTTLLLVRQYRKPTIFLVAEIGLEPMTFGLWNRRAANCSTLQYVLFVTHLISFTDQS